MFVFFLCLFLFFSCEKTPEMISETKQIEYTDAELSRIAENARNTVSSFFLHLGRKSAGEYGFCVKYPFFPDGNSREGSEQIWLNDIHFKNGNYYGVLANNPQFIQDIKKGDVVIFNTDLITDWMYVRDKKIIGGFSIKYLLEKIPEDHRSEAQRELLKMF